MALLSSAILNDALENVARVLVDDTTLFDHYGAMGVGNGVAGAVAADTDLGGGETHYNAVVGTYEANYKGVWETFFIYADLATHIFTELVVCYLFNDHANKCLLRIVIDAITLNPGEQVTFIIKCAVMQGT